MIDLHRGPKNHELKTLFEPFRKVWSGKKRAELRLDDGRDFRIGDTMSLMEWKPRKHLFSGRAVQVRITDITRLCQWIDGVDHRWVMLSFETVTG